MDEILNKKVAIVKKIEVEILTLLEKVRSIFVKEENVYVQKITTGMQHLKSAVHSLLRNTDSNSIANRILLYNDSIVVNILLQIINDNFNKILDRKINVETFLSQTYISETREYHQKVQLLFGKLKKEISQIDDKLLLLLSDSIVDDLSKSEDVYASFLEFTNMIETVAESIELYKLVANKLLVIVTERNIQQAYDIMNVIEVAKNKLLSKINKKPIVHTYKPINTFIKNFGFINVTELQSLGDIVNLIFKPTEQKPSDVKGVEGVGGAAITKSEMDQGEFAGICKERGYDLIFIKKVLNRGITYNILPLIDFNRSKEFEKHHSVDDGVSVDIVERYRTIEYISNAKDTAKWQIEYDYVHETLNNKFAIIVQELHKNKYCVLSNKFEPSLENQTYFVRKTTIKEFLHFVKTKSYNPTRVNNYNDIVNTKIVENMFLHVKPEVDLLRVKSQIIDPKYLRNEIFILVLSSFKKLLDKKSIKTIYEYSKLVHNEAYEKIFSQVIMNEYHKYLFKNTAIYESENISMSEIYVSFLPIISTYERDFKKNIHDIFLLNLPNKDIFADEKKDVLLFDIFEKLLSDVLHGIITNENNIFQTIIFKLYLFKLSLLD